jgi:hypothetical protein
LRETGRREGGQRGNEKPGPSTGSGRAL